MRLSNLFVPLRKNSVSAERCASADYMARMGYIDTVGAGAITHLPLGFAAFANVRNTLLERLDAHVGCGQMEFPGIHPQSLWEQSGRLELFGNGIFRLADQHGRNLVLAPTHEVTAAALAARFVQSYRDLPFVIAQSQHKFRDEVRPRGGVIRARQFEMHDAYRFDLDMESAKPGYAAYSQAYVDTLHALRLPFLVHEQTDMGAIGGDRSHEYQVPAAIGDDTVSDPDGVAHKSLEVGHTFALGTSYSETAGASYTTSDGSRRPVYMSSFGMGIERVAAAYIEVWADRYGADTDLIWSWALAPFQVLVMGDGALSAQAYQDLRTRRLRVLLDDRDVPFRQKLAEGFGFGFPIAVIAGARNAGRLEVTCKRIGRSEVVDPDQVAEAVDRLRDQLIAHEVAATWGTVTSMDTQTRTVIAKFERPWMITAGPTTCCPVGQDLLGNFAPGPRREPGSRIRAGSWWLVPVVRSEVTSPQLRHIDGMPFVAVGAGQSHSAKELAGYYWGADVGAA